MATITADTSVRRAPVVSDAPALSLATRLSYGAGAIANGTKGAAFNTYLMLFYNQVIGVPALTVSLAIFATLIVDAIADPIIGRWSDVTRTKWGRRHPFMYGAVIPTTIFFLLAWFPPAGMTNFQTLLWVFFTAMISRVSVSAFEINSSALTAELTDNYQERTKLFSLRYLFGYAGAYGFAAIALATIFVATPEYPRGQLNPDSYVWFAIFGAATIAGAILICALGTHSRIPWLRQAESREGGSGVFSHMREMAQAVNNRAFLAIVGFGIFKYSAIGLYSASTLYFGTYLFKFSGPQLALLTFDGLVAALLAAPLAPIASRYMGKRASSMVFAVLGVGLGVQPLLLSYLDLYFLPGDPWLVPTNFIIGAVYGAMVAISLINTSSMVADVVEDAAVRTGRRDAGTFFAASSFMQQCSSGIGIALAGLILSWSQFPEKVDPKLVTDAMTDSLLIHYIPTTFGLWAIGCLFLLFYPITRERHESNLDILRKRALEAEVRERELRDLPVGAPAR